MQIFSDFTDHLCHGLLLHNQMSNFLPCQWVQLTTRWRWTCSQRSDQTTESSIDPGRILCTAVWPWTKPARDLSLTRWYRGATLSFTGVQHMAAEQWRVRGEIYQLGATLIRCSYLMKNLSDQLLRLCHHIHIKHTYMHRCSSKIIPRRVGNLPLCFRFSF